MKKPVKPIDLAVVVCDFFVSHLVDGEDLASLSCQGVYFCSGKARAGNLGGWAGGCAPSRLPIWFSSSQDKNSERWGKGVRYVNADEVSYKIDNYSQKYILSCKVLRKKAGY